MSDPSSERVLVVPATVLHQAGLFQGFSPRVEHYLPRLLDAHVLAFLRRSQAEHDPAWKQLIPYVVLRWGGLIFYYTRGGGGGESRLHARRSIGLGGHISSGDGEPTPETYRVGLFRELGEEVLVETDFHERCIGLINDDRTPVGQVHLGIVHVIDLAAPRALERESHLIQTGFAPLAELRRQREEFETWSQFLLDGDWLLEESR
jgi:predicted NUDIX family phosphoesterase